MLNRQCDKLWQKLFEAWQDFQTGPEIRGEYWIISGEPVFADGDVGGMNHEAYVIQHLTSQFLEYFDIYEDDVGNLSEYDDYIKRWFIDEEIIDSDEKEEEYDMDPADFMFEYLWSTHGEEFNNKEHFQDAFFIAYQSSTANNARDFGMKHLRWKRIYGNNIQTWHLQNEDAQDISNGITKIIDQEFDIDDENIEKMLFNLEVGSRRQFYNDVPYKHLKSLDKLKRYRSDY
jgi:hypothetical protein